MKTLQVVQVGEGTDGELYVWLSDDRHQKKSVRIRASQEECQWFAARLYQNVCAAFPDMIVESTTSREEKL